MELVLDVILYWPIALVANYSTFLQQRMRGRHKQYQSLPEKTFCPWPQPPWTHRHGLGGEIAAACFCSKLARRLPNLKLLRSELLTPRLRVDAKPSSPTPAGPSLPRAAFQRRAYRKYQRLDASRMQSVTGAWPYEGRLTWHIALTGACVSRVLRCRIYDLQVELINTLR